MKCTFNTCTLLFHKHIWCCECSNLNGEAVCIWFAHFSNLEKKVKAKEADGLSAALLFLYGDTGKNKTDKILPYKQVKEHEHEKKSMDWLCHTVTTVTASDWRTERPWNGHNTSVLKCQTVYRTLSNIIPNRRACLEKSVTTMSPPLYSCGKNIQINPAANELVFTWCQKNQYNLYWNKQHVNNVWRYIWSDGWVECSVVFVVSTHAHSVVMTGQDMQQPGFRKNSDVLQLLEMLPWDMNTT